MASACAHSLVGAEDFPEDYEWSPEEMKISAPVRSALFVNVLTEDNLPYYFRDIERMFGRDGAWGEWVRRWTAEEGRHGLVINGYLMATRAIDPVEARTGRMAQVQSGQVPEPPTLAEGLAYVSLKSSPPASATSTPATCSTTKPARPSCVGSPRTKTSTTSSTAMR